MGLISNLFGRASDAPRALSATVPPAAIGIIHVVTRRLDGTSTLALVAGSAGNLSINNATGAISAAAAIGAGASQKAVVREALGDLAVKYPVTLTDAGTATPRPPANVRLAPDTVSRFYLMARNAWGTALAYKFERNVGGAALSDVGAPWQMWRITGVYELAAFGDTPTASIFMLGEDVGAWDYTVQRSTNFRNGFSYHGDQVLNSLSLTIDNVAVDPTVAANGGTFRLGHTSTATWPDATTATDTWSITIDGTGGVAESVSITSASAMSTETYPFMWIAGPTFTEAVAAGSTTAISTNGDYTLGTAGDVTMRSPSTGHSVRNVTNAPSISGYQATFVRRATSGSV